MPQPELLASGGTLEGWIRDVAVPLERHLLASFFMMVMFAAPLLRPSGRADNFGFEIAGPAGRGKSTLQQLMASAAGPAIGGEGSTYWRSANTTVNALETVLPTYQDMTLILDEAGLLPGSGKQDDRAIQMRDLTFRLASGRAKHRMGEQLGQRYRGIFVLSTNRTVAALVGPGHLAEVEAIADRLMTVPLTEDRTGGIFDHTPPGYGSTGAFAESLKVAASSHFGHALPAFLQYLVQRIADHPKELNSWLQDRIASFVEASRADRDDGSQLRVAKAFGLVAAAGGLAKLAGVLPEGYRPRAAALACYRLHRDHGRVARSFADRLRALARHPSTIDLAEVDRSALTIEQRRACRAYLYTGRSGTRELLVPVRMRNLVFPDWNRIRHEIDVQQRLRRSEPDRSTNDRPIPGRRKTVYCFDVADLGI